MTNTGFFPGPGFGVPPIFMIFFLAILGVIIYSLVKEASRWATNQSSPVEEKYARIVAKRSHVWGGGGNHRARTSYYATFEFEDGERMELPIKAPDFGMLVEGDVGILNYQGTQYNSFQREIVRD